MTHRQGNGLDVNEPRFSRPLPATTRIPSTEAQGDNQLAPKFRQEVGPPDPPQLSTEIVMAALSGQRSAEAELFFVLEKRKDTMTGIARILVVIPAAISPQSVEM